MADFKILNPTDSDYEEYEDINTYIESLSGFAYGEIDGIMANILESISGGICLIKSENDDVVIKKINKNFAKLFYLPEDNLENINFSIKNIFDSKYFDKILEFSNSKNNQKNDDLLTFKFSIKFKSGELKILRIYVKNFVKDNEHFSLCLFFNITKQTHLSALLKMHTERYELIRENTEENFFDYDVIADSLYMTCTITRYPTDENNLIEGFIANNLPQGFVHPSDYEAYRQVFNDMLKAPTKGTFEFRTKAYDDDYTWYRMPYKSVADEAGDVVHVYGKLYNIQNIKNLTQKIYQDTEYINHLLTTDSLTGLLTRKEFKKQAEEIIANRDKNYCYGICYSDINGFSYVNDNFGFKVGDRVLKEFAEIIQDTDSTLLCCRIYSDFFVGLYRAKTRDDLIEDLKARNLRFADLQKKNFPNSDLHLASGVYIYSNDQPAPSIQHAIDNANMARKNVKGSQSIICGVYSHRLREQRVKDQMIANEVHTAMKNRNIELFLQPKFSMKTREIIGAEALCRWRNDDGSYKMPYEFIPVLEKVGYIEDLDFYIFEEVLRTMDDWKKRGKELLPISVNFSQNHFVRTGFVEKVVDLTDKYGIDKSLLEIEVTESCFAGDMNSLFYDMKCLRKYGYKIDIDDFGVGYSTLSMLINAPVDIVKIDKSFIDNLETNPIDRDYVGKMCALVTSFKKDIIFEGVETEGQADILCACGYTKAQGWLFDKAISVSEFNRKYMDIV